MVVIVECDETKGLKHAALAFLHRIQHFRHPLYIAGVGLESDLDKVSF